LVFASQLTFESCPPLIRRPLDIWAGKEKKEWQRGQEVGLRWIPEGQGVRYLGIQIGFRLPTEAKVWKTHAHPKREDDRLGQVQPLFDL